MKLKGGSKNRMSCLVRPCKRASAEFAATGSGSPTMQQPKTMNLTEWGLLVLLSVLWGGAFFFVGVAVVELPPLTVVLARVGIAAAILLGLTLLLGRSLPRRLSARTPFLVMGLLNNAVPFSFLNAGQTMVSVGLASAPLADACRFRATGRLRKTLGTLTGTDHCGTQREA